MIDFNTEFWCQKVLPLVYDDSLSYYEVLCKLVKTIDDLIKAVTQDFKDVDTKLKTLETEIEKNESAIVELQKSYKVLKKYVDDYFDNLDVQSEINAKIDSMVASGELADVLQPQLNVLTEKSAKISSAYAKLLASCMKIGNKTTGATVKTEGFKIVAVGNSITYGAGSEQSLTWADRIAFDLRNVARTLGLTWEYTNMAIGGSVISQTYASDFYPSTLGRDLPWAEEGKTWKQSILDKNANIILTSFGMNDGGGVSNTVTAGTFYNELLTYNTTFHNGGKVTMCYLNDIAPKDSTGANTSDIFVRNKVALAQEMREFSNTNRTINFFDSFSLSHVLQWGVDKNAYNQNPITLANYNGHPFNNGTLYISYKDVPIEETSVADVYLRRFNSTKQIVIRPVDGVAKKIKIYLFNTASSGQLLGEFTVSSFENVKIQLFDNWITVNDTSKWEIKSGFYPDTVIMPRAGAENYITNIRGTSYDPVNYSGGLVPATTGLMHDSRHPTSYGQSMMMYAAISPWVNEVYTQIRNA